MPSVILPGRTPAPHDALFSLPRSERKHILAIEARRRKSGQWPAWERIEVRPGDLPGSGWLRAVRVIHRNWVFSVLERPVVGATHLAITSLSGVRPTWWEAQRIKNEIAGEAATAVEVYPPASEVVDEADMYHLWILPDPLPFSLCERAP